MNHFPVTNSNLSATHIALFLQEKYAMSALTSAYLIRAGINDTYVVTDKEKFVFRVYSLNWRTKEEINEEIRLLNLLKQKGIPVSYPVADQHQQYIQQLHAPEGERFAVLFSFAEGEKLHKVPATLHFMIGRLMAQMHQVTNELKINRVHYHPEVLLVESLTKLEKFLSPGADEMKFMRETQQYLLDNLLKINTAQLRKGIVHLDFWFDNLNIADKNKITLFDFDFCGNGWLCLDIAYYIMQLCNIEQYDISAYQPKIDSFLKGYESVVQISEEEKGVLQMLGVGLYFFYLGIQCQRYDNWSNSFLSENYLKRFINGLVKRYFELENPVVKPVVA